MRVSILPGLVLASSLIASPVLAQAQSAAPQSAAQRLSVTAAQQRAGAPVAARNNAAGGNWGWIIGAIGLVAGVTYALIQKNDDDDDEPASP